MTSNPLATHGEMATRLADSLLSNYLLEDAKISREDMAQLIVQTLFDLNLRIIKLTEEDEINQHLISYENSLTEAGLPLIARLF